MKLTTEEVHELSDLYGVRAFAKNDLARLKERVDGALTAWAEGMFEEAQREARIAALEDKLK